MADRATSSDALLQALESVQFVIGRDGHQSGVFMDSAGWEALLGWLEDLEDRALVQGILPRLRVGPVKSDALRWEEVAAEWDDESS
jgi:hypothetical protein